MFHYKLRRTIFIISVIVFFLIATILIFRVQGFRYDFENHRLTKTGMLIAQYYPDNAQVWVNNKLYQNSGGVSKINNLIPKDYIIRITCPGYQTWEKRLTIKSELVTWANNIRLFPEKPVIKNLTSDGLTKVSFSPDKKNVAYLDKDGILFIFHPKNSSSNLSIEQSDLNGYNIINLVSWSPDNKKLIITARKGKSTHYFLVTLTNNNILSINNSKLLITDLTPKLRIDKTIIHPQSIQWINQSSLLIKDKETLYELGISESLLKNHTLPRIVAKNISTFQTDGNKVYFIQKEKNATCLKVGSFQIITGSLSLETSVDLPKLGHSNYQILISKNGQLALLDNENNDLFIVNEGKLNLIAKDVESAKWSQDNKKIAWQNKHEIWLYLLDEKKYELLTRYAGIIKNIIWYPDSAHLIFRVGNKVKIIECDLRDKPDIQNLIQISLNNTFIKCDKQGKYLYFLDKRENKATNLLQLNLE